MSKSSPARSRRSGYGALTIGVLAALAAATGRPDQEALAALTGLGLPQGLAVAAMYVAPVAIIVLAVLIGRALARGRPAAVRWVIFAGFGAAAGFVLGLCLDLFAGLPDLASRAFGPLSEPTLLDVSLWIMAGFSLVCGFGVAAIALLGPPAMTALQVEEADPECLEVRRTERAVFAWSALGMLTLGASSAGLAIARQAAEDARLIPVVIAGVAALISALANYRLWAGFDEMQRRHVVEGYAASAVVATLGAFVWAMAEALGYVPGLDATGVFLALLFVQLVATSYVTTSVMGQMSLVGKPA